ncbi:hypothetical protein B0H10DRAFT_1955436 [Mycena sp. CBHHK59/15]|nr:hypothetical protein B0H10DRAFT_1955436 [Mycena sp. CBHHK59/15]
MPMSSLACSILLVLLCASPLADFLPFSSCFKLAQDLQAISRPSTGVVSSEPLKTSATGLVQNICRTANLPIYNRAANLQLSTWVRFTQVNLEQNGPLEPEDEDKDVSEAPAYLRSNLYPSIPGHQLFGEWIALYGLNASPMTHAGD